MADGPYILIFACLPVFIEVALIGLGTCVLCTGCGDICWEGKENGGDAGKTMVIYLWMVEVAGVHIYLQRITSFFSTTYLLPSWQMAFSESHVKSRKKKFHT